jgi:hypothetical protein
MDRADLDLAFGESIVIEPGYCFISCYTLWTFITVSSNRLLDDGFG